MRILTVISYYHPHWTGLTSHAVRVAEGLVARGHQVTVVTTRHAPGLPRRETLRGVEVVRLRPLARFSRGMILPALPFAVAARLRRSDVVHLHTPLPEALVVAALGKATRRPLVMTHHGDVVLPPGRWNRLVEAAARFVLRETARLSRAVTSYSLDYARSSPVLAPSLGRVAAILPPVELPEPDRAAASAWREALGLRDRPVVGVAGRWVREKGLDVLLDAMPLVRERLPGAHLVFAGETNVVYEACHARDAPRLAAQQGHFTSVGLLREPRRIADFYAMCDALALPSRTEMLGIVQVEAMLCGTPVVASDIPGARVAVATTGFGRLVPPEDPAALADGLVDVLRDPGRHRATREAVRTVFDTDASLAAYERLLSASAGKRPRPEAADRAVPGKEPASTLTAGDHALLDRALRDEADMAYRRRCRALMEYLELRDGHRVLDCGCGFGEHLRLMRRLRRVDAVGVDVDRERLRRARAGGGRVTVAAAARLPFADATFDRVLMSEVLEHVEDDRRALAEVFRVIRPGGVLALSVPHERYPFLWDPINRVWTALGGDPIRRGPIAGIWSGHRVLYEPEALAAAVREAGFATEGLREATHHAFPFSHFLLYGIGKPLVERKLLPASLRRAAERGQDGGRPPSRLNPVALAVAALRLVDRLNDREPAPRHRTFVNVLVKARKAERA
jgi:glycosyltransferase involved in cell wall biosynthesis